MRISTERLRGRSVALLVVVATLGASAAGASAADVQLIQAVKNGDATAVRALLGRGADVDARLGDGATALHWAAHLNDLETADLLIRAGAAVDATNDLGVTPLWVATTAGSAAMVAKLLEARGDPNIAPDTGGTPLMIAARQGNVAAVRSLLAHGADVNAREGAQGQTALMWAVSQRRPEAVRVLLEAGADLYARTRSSRRHVLLCCQKSLGKTEGVVWVEQGGFTPLLFAARHGAAASAELLVAAGAPIDDTAAVGATPLVVAAQYGLNGVAAVLLEMGADPDAAGPGQAALHWAALRGDRELVEILLAHGANPNVRLTRGSFLKHDRRAFAFDKFLIGATPFVVAARRSDTGIMRLLEAGGADTSLPAAGWPDRGHGCGRWQEHRASSTQARGRADSGHGQVGARSGRGCERNQSVRRHRPACSGGQQVRQRHSAPRRAWGARECAESDGPDAAGGCARAARGPRRIGHRRRRPREVSRGLRGLGGQPGPNAYGKPAPLPGRHRIARRAVGGPAARGLDLHPPDAGDRSALGVDTVR